MTTDSLSHRQVSRQELLVVQALGTDKWITTRELAAKLPVAPRTVRHHVKRLHEDGLVECQRIFGGFLYRLRGDAPTRNPDRLAQLKAAAKVLGMS